MAKRTSTNIYLPAKRRLLDWENSGVTPPLQIVRPEKPKSPKKKAFFLAFIRLLLLVAVIFFLSLGIRFLINWFSAEKIITEMPLFVLPVTTAELPAVENVRFTHVIRKVKKNETLEKIFTSIGLSDELEVEVHDRFSKLQQEKKIKRLLQTGQAINFVFSLDTQLQRVATEPEAGKKLIVEKTKSGKFSTRVKTQKQEKRERVFMGTIESSFAAAANKAEVSYEIVDDLVDLFSDRVEFNKDFHRGDRFTVIFRDKLLSDGRLSGEGTILAAALEINGDHLIAARFVGTDGKARYFNEKGQILGNSFLRYPLKFSRISSYFSQSRFHPVLKFARPHNGVDFAAPIGTPVRTIGNGEIIFAGRTNSTGNSIKIRHSQRFTTEYFHLSAISAGLKKGSKVNRGEVIGAVGMTGLATGPHLHFGFFDNDKYVDPLKAKLPMLDSLGVGNDINPNYLKRVLFTLEHYQTVSLDSYYQAED